MAAPAPGRPEGALARLEARLGLASSEELFHALVAQAPVGVWVADVEGRGVYVNGRLCELTGLSLAESLDAGWASALHPDDEDRVGTAWAAAAASGEDFGLEYRFLRPDGSVVWVKASACLVRHDRGAGVGWVGICVDVTARKLSEERYRGLFEHAADAVFTTDTAGNFTAVNLATAQMTGFSRAELLAMNFFDLLAPEEPAAVRQILTRQFDSGSDEVIDLQLVAKEGRRLSVEVSARLVLEHGQSAGIEAIARDTTERRALQARLIRQAFYDDLTGLPNRPLFLDRLNHALARAQRRPTGERLAVIMLDLDNFKLVNDSLGHPIGDELLRVLATEFQAAIRPSDTVARLGGDEFAILLEGIEDERAAIEVAERIISIFAQPLTLGHARQSATSTFGIAVAQPGDSADALLANAENAMYQAKKKDRGGYQIYNRQMRARVERELAVRDALTEAIEAGELMLHYQPIVGLQDQRLLGAEALLRWQHPQWGWVQPSEFIPIAEQTGLIVRLSRYVLAEAARRASDWRKRFPEQLPWGIAINLSPRELAEQDFLSSFSRIILEQGAQPTDLTVEVTERSFLDVHETTLAENLAGLHQLGVRLSLDDFGTGYSALASLQRLPFSIVKIDRFFIRQITRESPRGPITEAVINLAHTLGIDVIAEGVETPVQAEYLRSLGCRAAQGFYFGRPTAANTLTSLIASATIPTVNDAATTTSRRADRCA